MLIKQFLYVSFLLLCTGNLFAVEGTRLNIEQTKQADKANENIDYVPTFEFNVSRGEGLKRNKDSSLSDPDSAVFNTDNRENLID